MAQQPQIFCWHGKNSFEIEEKLQSWKEAFSAKHSAFNVYSFCLSEAKNKKDFWEQLKSSLQSDSLFGMNKLVVLRDFQSKEEKAANNSGMQMLCEVLPKLPKNFFVIFIDGEANKSSSISKVLIELQDQGKAEIKEFVLPVGSSLTKWIICRVEKNGSTIKENAANLLASLVGSNLVGLSFEIQKLTAFKKSSEIINEDVKTLVSGRYNDNIFQLLDALAAKNKKQALLCFSDLLNSGASDMYILTMLIRQFRILLSLQALGKNQSLNEKVAAKELGIHPFEAKKALTSLSRFKPSELKNIYSRLFDFDIKLKSSVVDFELLFDLLISDLQ